MSKRKFQSLRKRADAVTKRGLLCQVCEEEPPVLQCKGVWLCSGCLNPDIDNDLEYLTEDRHYWCDMKSNWGVI